MMSPERLEAEVRNLMLDGYDAARISRRLGVPIERVRLVVHQVNGRDPAKVAAETASKHRQADRQLFGTTLGMARQIGPNRSRGKR